jgi:hypothetical protein
MGQPNSPARLPDPRAFTYATLPASLRPHSYSRSNGQPKHEGRPQTPPVGNTPRPQEYAALPPEPELEEKSSGETSGRPTRDWNWKAGPTSYSSGASTSKDDFRKWGRMGGPSSAAPRSSYGGGSALRQSLILAAAAIVKEAAEPAFRAMKRLIRAERGEGSGLGLAGVPPVPEEQDITSAAPLLRESDTSPYSPPRAPTREHAEFGLRPPLPPAPVDHRSSQFSARTAGSQATQGTAYFDAKSTLASSARDTARGPSPLGQTAWSAPRSLAGTPMMEPYPVGPQDIPSTSTSTPVQEVTVTPRTRRAACTTGHHYLHQPSACANSQAPTPQIQHAQPVDVLDVPPPPAATRDFRQQPSLSTVFSVGSLEAFHEALGTGQPEVSSLITAVGDQAVLLEPDIVNSAASLLWMTVNASRLQDWHQIQGSLICLSPLQCPKADHLPTDKLSLALVPQTLHKYTKSSYDALVKLPMEREVKEVPQVATEISFLVAF